MNMVSFFKPWVEKSPDKTAIIFEDGRISHREFDKLVNKLANGLLSLGLKRGDVVVSLFLPSLPELLMGYLGAVKTGLVVNVVNAMLKDIEVEYILKDCQT